MAMRSCILLCMVNQEITKSDIKKLAAEASGAGDEEQYALCVKALSVGATIREQREASRLCSEMARDTACDANRGRFERDGQEIDNGYAEAIERIEARDWSEALATLEGVKAIEKSGGDAQHASKTIEAVEACVACEKAIRDARARSGE